MVSDEGLGVNVIENIEAVEKRLWTAADQLRANSDFASNEYFMPVMGLIFLRHAYSRYLAVKPEIEASLPSRGGVTPPLTKQDFTSRGAIFLRPEAQFEHLVGLPDGADRAAAIIAAMEAVEDDYAALKGVLPKTEYQSLENDVLGNVLRIFNDPSLQDAKGDVFGRIYEYFLTQFADQSAHDGGEFFTPPSIVQMIVNAIEPDHTDAIGCARAPETVDEDVGHADHLRPPRGDGNRVRRLMGPGPRSCAPIRRDGRGA